VQAIEGGPVTVIPGDHFSITAYSWAADSRHILIDKDEDGAENDHILIADVERPDQPLVDATPAPGSRSIVDFVRRRRRAWSSSAATSAILASSTSTPRSRQRAKIARRAE